MPEPRTAALQEVDSGLRDNRTRGSVADFLRSVIQPDAKLSIASAYFTIYAYDQLKPQLDAIGGLDFLFGEPSFLGQVNPDRMPKKSFIIDAEGLSLATQLQQKRVARDCAAWIEKKVNIRTVRQANLLHGKMYHVARGALEQAILGSSNFTLRGLGLGGATDNIELNLVVDGNRDRRELKAWFDEIWNDEKLVVDVKQEVLRYLRRLYADQSPQFIYYLTLFHLFRDFLDGTHDIDEDLRRIALTDTDVWRALFTFQKDGAKAAIKKILDFNGCILADSVGLGKTYTALAVIKYFELRNERVLVLCPKKLTKNWTKYRNNSSLNPFLSDRFRYDVLHHTDLSRTRGNVNGIHLEEINWGNYDLVVIDESHNFRNNRQAVQREGSDRRRSRYQRLIEDIITSGARTKVLLLSATPVNNQLADLRNQISFIAGGDVAHDDKPDLAFAESLGIASIRETTRQAQAQFTLWSRRPAAQRRTRDLISAIGGDFFRMLDGLSIARSRRQIAAYYADEMEKLGGFPTRTPPRAVHPAIDSKGKFPSFEELEPEIDRLQLSIYHPTSKLRKDLPAATRDDYNRKILGGFTQEGREQILITMMKVNFLKRLESSIDSFRLTLERTIAKIDTVEKSIADFEAHRDAHPDIDYDALKPEAFEDPDFDEEEFTIGGRQKIHLGHLDLPAWLKAIRQDRKQLKALLKLAEPVSAARDGKLEELRRIIAGRVAKPATTRDGRPNRKVLVFTAFADTARYLYRELVDWARKDLGLHVGLVCGDGGNLATLGRTDFDDILTNFAPLAKERDRQKDRFPNQKDEIDLLIATDCISEGQNLQDCDFLVNYDIHWNPVRIIQRFGRIDRIGSRNEEVHLVNFWPVADLDAYLGVKLRVESRMALVDLTATQTDNLLDRDQLDELIKEDLLFRNRQLKRLREEVIDLEELGESVSLTDFSLDEFRLDLMNYLRSNRDALEEAGEGLYAVVPPKSKVPGARPGAIFCLRHRAAATQRDAAFDARKLNPLDPYYLVYVHDDGEVRLTFAQPKECILLMRDLAAGESKAFETLCSLFDRRTGDGKDMKHYDKLLTAALESIEKGFGRRVTRSLAQSRGAVLPRAGQAPVAEGQAFDLVTWLVILAE